MNWFDKFQGLFKREITSTEVEAIFRRVDLDSYFNTLNNLWHPGELITKMGGYENLPLLHKDSEIYSSVDKRLASLLDTRLVLSDSPHKQFFEDQLFPHEDQLKQDFWWAIPYGYGVEQIVYNEDRSGRVDGFQKEQFYRFMPLPDLIHAKVIYSSSPGLTNTVLPWGKWVVTTNNGTHDNPMGDAMFERLIMPWIFRCNGWDLWMDFAKRFANGFMHASIDDISKRDEVRAALEAAGKSSIVVTDKGSELNMVQSARDSTLYSVIDDKTSQVIQRVVLGETLSSSMQIRGSSGAAEIHNDVRMEKTKADIRLVSRSINETIKQIGAVNKFDPKSLPVASLIFDPGVNSEQALRDQSLRGAGVKFTKKYFIKNYGFDEDDIEIIEPQPQFFSAKKKSTYLSPDDMKEFLGIKDTGHQCPVHLDAANVGRKDRRQIDEKEDVVTFLNRNGEPPIDNDDLISAILLSKNQDELESNLSALFDQRSVGFVDTLTEALYYTATKGALLGNPERLKPDEEE